jgi:hypothetical protein
MTSGAYSTLVPRSPDMQLLVEKEVPICYARHTSEGGVYHRNNLTCVMILARNCIDTI